MKKQQVTVLGDGAWGTAIAQLLAHNGHHVMQWCYSQHVATEINRTRHNAYFLPNIALSPHITATTSLEEALAFSNYIFEAIPVKFLRSIVTQAQPFARNNHQWVILSKGIENDTLMLPSEILHSTLAHMLPEIIISGPSYAYDVAHHKLTSLVIASQSSADVQPIHELINNAQLHLSRSFDTQGIQRAAAFKNVVALALAILEGASHGENTRTFAFMRLFQEMQTFITHYNSPLETVYGPAGLGDLVLTAWGTRSKNRSWGIKIGHAMTQGLDIHELLKSPSHLNNQSVGSQSKEFQLERFKPEIPQPEGLNTLISLRNICIQDGISLPLSHALYQIIFENEPLALFINTLTK